MDNHLLPTVITVKCICKRQVNIRTKHAIENTVCWHCMRKITTYLGSGKGNVRVYIDSISITPISIIQ